MILNLNQDLLGGFQGERVASRMDVLFFGGGGEPCDKCIEHHQDGSKTIAARSHKVTAGRQTIFSAPSQPCPSAWERSRCVWPACVRASLLIAKHPEALPKKNGMMDTHQVISCLTTKGHAHKHIHTHTHTNTDTRNKKHTNKQTNTKTNTNMNTQTKK